MYDFYCKDIYYKKILQIRFYNLYSKCKVLDTEQIINGYKIRILSDYLLNTFLFVDKYCTRHVLQ